MFFVCLLWKYGIRSFKNKWTYKLHLLRRYILYTFRCVFSSMDFYLFLSSICFFLCHSCMSSYLSYLLCVSRSRTLKSWVWIMKPSVSGASENKEALELLPCWVMGFLELLSSILPGFYVVAVFLWQVGSGYVVSHDPAIIFCVL